MAMPRPLTKSPDGRDESAVFERARAAYGLATAMAVGVTAYFALFPFDFHRSGDQTLGGSVAAFDLTFNEDYAFLDLPVNVVFFVPFGFALAGLMRALSVGPIRIRVGVAGAGLLLAFAFELLQAVLLTRFASVADVVANGLGASIGAEVFLRWGDGVVSWAGSVGRKVVDQLDVRRLALVGIVWFAAAVGISAAAGATTTLSGWDSTFPLLVGNESEGNRPWEGTMSSLYLVDAVVDDDDARALSEGRPGDLAAHATALVRHDFRSGLDGTPSLVWEGAGEGQVDRNGVRLGAKAWLASPGPVEEVSRALDDSSAFTLILDAATNDLGQGGPARLVSISDGTTTRNLTVGQEGADLVLRIRTRLFGPDGSAPELVVSDVFTDTSPRRLVVRFDGSALSATVDGPDGRMERSTELAPEVAGLLLAFPNEITAMRIGSSWVLLCIYRILVFLPMACLAAMMVTRRVIGGLIAAVVVGMLAATGFEAALAVTIAAYDMRVSRVVLSASVVAISTATILLCRRLLSRPVVPGRRVDTADKSESPSRA
jgi:hypothetical protein